MLDKRVVRIFQQSQGVETGTQNTLPWRMQWEDNQTRRWTNPLMGWSSTSDPLSNTHMTLEFQSAEDAVRFCDRNGTAPRRGPAPCLTRGHPPAPTRLHSPLFMHWEPAQGGHPRSSSRSRAEPCTPSRGSTPPTSRGRGPRGATSRTSTSLRRRRRRRSEEAGRVGEVERAGGGLGARVEQSADEGRPRGARGGPSEQRGALGPTRISGGRERGSVCGAQARRLIFVLLKRRKTTPTTRARHPNQTRPPPFEASARCSTASFATTCVDMEISTHRM